MRLTRIIAGVAALALAVGTSASAVGDEIGSADIVQWDTLVDSQSRDEPGSHSQTASLVEFPVAVPGDQATRTAVATNITQFPVTATVELARVTATDQPDTVNTELKDLVHLRLEVGDQFWEGTWSQAMASADTDQVTWRVDVGSLRPAETFPITVTVWFPVEATEGTSSGRTSQALSFQVRVTMVEQAGGPESHTGGQAPSSLLGWVIVIALILTGLLLGGGGVRIRYGAESAPRK